MRYSEQHLRQFVEQVLLTVGVSLSDAQSTAYVLIEADVTGRHTHGVSRLPLYVNRLESGLISVNPQLRWSQKMHPTMARLDGGNGLGPAVALQAVKQSMATAKEMGIGAIAVYRSNHCGALSVYCEMGSREGLITMAMTNTPPAMAPWGGQAAYLGTNPIAWGFPRGLPLPPLIIDMATSTVARGNILDAARLGQPIPLGWALDSAGVPTTDANAALGGGTVLPTGGPKGYAMALAVEILTGVLSGAGIGPTVYNPYKDQNHESNVGHFFLTMDPQAFLPGSEFYQRLEVMEEQMRRVPATSGAQVTLPGDRSAKAREEYTQRGIPLDIDLIGQLDQLAQRLGAAPLSSPESI